MASDFDAEQALAEHLITSSDVSEITVIIEPAATNSLQEILSDPAAGRLSCTDIRRIAGDWATGLVKIHELPAIHRDIKPGNLGLIAFGGVILDLGHMIHGVNSDDHCAGTISYLAPEIMAHKRQFTTRGSYLPGSQPPVGARSDVYSLGLSLALWLVHEHSPSWSDRRVSPDKGVTNELLGLLHKRLVALKKEPPSWISTGDEDPVNFNHLIDTVRGMTNPDPKYRFNSSEVVVELNKAQFTPSPPPRRMLPFLNMAGFHSSSSNDD